MRERVFWHSTSQPIFDEPHLSSSMSDMLASITATTFALTGQGIQSLGKIQRPAPTSHVPECNSPALSHLFRTELLTITSAHRSRRLLRRHTSASSSHHGTITRYADLESSHVSMFEAKPESDEIITQCLRQWSCTGTIQKPRVSH